MAFSRSEYWSGQPFPAAFPFSFPHISVGEESTCNLGDPGSVSGLGRSTGEAIGYPLQYSGLDNSKNCIVHGVTESDKTEQLSLSHG